MTDSLPESNQPEAMLEKKNIQLLKPHPLQKFYFRDEAGADVDELAADILANGLCQLIEIAPDGTILSGHRRRTALLRLVAQGHEELQVLEVWVRHDLAAEGSDALKKRFLEENRNRRHLTPTAYAAVSRAIYELDVGTGHSDSELRQRIARQYNVNVKTLERWWALLDLPIELQFLIEGKELSRQLGQQLLDHAEPHEIQELAELARSRPAEEVKQRALAIVKGRKPAKPRKETPPDRVLQQFSEASLDMTIQYEAIEEIVHRDLGERQQMLYYYRRFKQAELVVRRLLDIISTTTRLEADELEYQPMLGRSSVADLLKAPESDSLGAADSTAKPESKRMPPPLKLGPAQKLPLKLPPLKLRRRPPAA